MHAIPGVYLEERFLGRNLLLGLILIWKSKIGIIAGWLFSGVLATVFLASEFSGRQPATLALDIGLSALKLVMPVLIALAVQEILSKDIERRFYLYSFAYPNSKSQVLLGRLASVALVSVFTVFLMAIGILLSVHLVSLGYNQATAVNLGIKFWIVIGFLSVDILSVVCVAVLFATISSTLGFVLIGTLGFTLVARSFSGVLRLLEGSTAVVENSAAYKGSVNVLGFIFPDLGSLDVRSIALYNDMAQLPQGWVMLLVATIFYMLTIIVLSGLIFRNRRFA